MEIVSVLRQKKTPESWLCYCLEEAIDPDFTEIKRENILDNWVEPVVEDVRNDAWVSVTLADPSKRMLHHVKSVIKDVSRHISTAMMLHNIRNWPGLRLDMT